MLSFTYILTYGTLNIFKVQGTTILNWRTIEINNYILTEKNINEVKNMKADDIYKHILPVTLKNLISKSIKYQ